MANGLKRGLFVLFPSEGSKDYFNTRNYKYLLWYIPCHVRLKKEVRFCVSVSFLFRSDYVLAQEIGVGPDTVLGNRFSVVSCSPVTLCSRKFKLV